MPGLSQLEKFAQDVSVLGDEIKKRSSREEPIIQLSLPSDVPATDDSEDFIFGLPTEETMAVTNIEANIEDDFFSIEDGSGEIDPDLERLLNGFSQGKEQDTNLNNFDNIENNNIDNIAKDDIFENIENNENIEKSVDSLDALNTMTDLGSIDDLIDFDEVNNLDDIDFNTDGNSPIEIVDTDSQNDFEIENHFELENKEPENANAENANAENKKPVLDLSSLSYDETSINSEDLGELEELPLNEETFNESFNESFNEPDFSLPESMNVEADNSFTDAFSSDVVSSLEPSVEAEDDFGFDVTDYVPSENSMGALRKKSTDEDDKSGSGNDDFGKDDFGKDDFPIDNTDIDLNSVPDFETSATSFEAPEVSFDIPETNFESPEVSDLSQENSSSDGLGLDNLDFDNMDFDNMNLASMDFDNLDFDPPPNIDFSSSTSLEKSSDMASTDASGNDALENDAVSTAAGKDAADYETIGATENDVSESESANAFDSDMFNLPDEYDGFGSSVLPTMTAEDAIDSLDDFNTTDGMLQESEDADDEFVMPILDEDDFKTKTSFVKSDSNSGDEEKRTFLTDGEYETFKANLAEYPLNLRIVVEDLIVKNEFTDDTVFGVIEKILKKVTARQLASYLDKYLDINVDVPRDFERRTPAQYDLYKQSLQYQLKNRIIPSLIVGILVIGFITIVSIFGNKYVYKPIAANNAYKEGYVLLESNMYQQSEIKFNQAVQFKPMKKWFFKYAQGYRTHKQYDRARTKYLQTLRMFKQDKAAGLEYAEMEFLELENYSAAETILRREVLDYYINDKDALLMLGDVFLEWATEKDSSKFDEAYSTYTDLIELYGNTDLYTARLMRYYIRTDKLKEVLPLKNYFHGKKKSLTAPDLVELSGYLLEKLYGELLPKEEYLRSEIEDVRSLLEDAIKADNTVPEAYYNYGKYFVYTGNNLEALTRLETALTLFDKAEQRRPKRIYKHIDTYRLMGELQTQGQEYILAEETFGKGIELFEEEKKHSNLSPVENIGKLYSGLGDIDYFISGDLDIALHNYKNAISCGYDVPAVNYKCGYVEYNDGNFDNALEYFMKTVAVENNDVNALFALGNVFALRGNDSTAHGYYTRLMSILEQKRSLHKVLFPQVHPDHYELVDMYMKTANNLGTTLSKLAERFGDSSKTSKAMVYFSEGNRAYDALTRNPETMVRLEGSNLSAQNMKYLTASRMGYDCAYYTEIPKILTGEKVLSQDFVK